MTKILSLLNIKPRKRVVVIKKKEQGGGRNKKIEENGGDYSKKIGTPRITRFEKRKMQLIKTLNLLDRELEAIEYDERGM